MSIKLYQAPTLDIGGVYPENQPKELRNLLYSIAKEYFPDFADEIGKITVFWDGERKVRSAMIGETIPPNETYPNGLIVIYPDALTHFADFSKIDSIAFLVSTFLHEVRHYLDNKKGRFADKSNPFGIDQDFEDRAEAFALRLSTKLAARKVIPMPVPSTGYPKLQALFGVWVKEWTGFNAIEWNEMVASIGPNGEIEEVKPED